MSRRNDQFSWRMCAVAVAAAAVALGTAARVALAAASEAANPIVRENAHKGTRDWILRNPKVPGAKRYFGGIRSPNIIRVPGPLSPKVTLGSM